VTRYPPIDIQEPDCFVSFNDSEEEVETGRAQFAKLKTPDSSHGLTNLAPKRGWLTTALAWVASFVYVALYAIVERFP
jgi:hypothetical protein